MWGARQPLPNSQTLPDSTLDRSWLRIAPGRVLRVMVVKCHRQWFPRTRAEKHGWVQKGSSPPLGTAAPSSMMPGRPDMQADCSGECLGGQGGPERCIPRVYVGAPLGSLCSAMFGLAGLVAGQRVVLALRPRPPREGNLAFPLSRSFLGSMFGFVSVCCINALRLVSPAPHSWCFSGINQMPFLAYPLQPSKFGGLAAGLPTKAPMGHSMRRMKHDLADSCIQHARRKILAGKIFEPLNIGGLD